MDTNNSDFLKGLAGFRATPAPLGAPCPWVKDFGALVGPCPCLVKTWGTRCPSGAGAALNPAKPFRRPTLQIGHKLLFFRLKVGLGS